MIHAPAGFIDALRFGTFLVDARLTVYSSGAPTRYLVPVSTVNITASRTAAQRSAGSITAELPSTVPPQAMMPTWPGSPLAPFGSEVFIEVALQTSAQPPSAWVPLGLFTIATSEVTDSGTDVTVTLTVYDRSWVIDQRAFRAPYSIPASTGYFDDEIRALVNQVWGSTPPMKFNLAPTDQQVPTASYNEGSSPWQAVMDMAAAAGQEVYFDENGVLTAHAIPDPTTQPVVFSFGPNSVSVQGDLTHPVGSSPYATPTGIVSTMTRDRVYNDVIVSGTGTQNVPSSTNPGAAPVRAEAKDTNNNSPTFFAGPVGDVPEFVQTPLATTQAAAQAIADNDLQAALAQAWTLQVSVPLNSLLQIDDVIQVTDPRIGLNNKRMVIDTIAHGVSYDASTQITGRVLP